MNIPRSSERYAALVAAYRQIGKPVHSRAAKIAMIDRATAAACWEHGWTALGPGHGPIKLVLEADAAGARKSDDSKGQNDHMLPYVAIPIVSCSVVPGGGPSPAGVSISAVSPTPQQLHTDTPTTNTDTVSKKGLSVKQKAARDREEDAVLGSLTNIVNLHKITQDILVILKDKVNLVDGLGTLGKDRDGNVIPDPYAAKHVIEQVTALFSASARASEAQLRVMEAARLNAGEAQSISETRTPDAPKAADVEAMQARIEYMAQVAASVARGRAVATHYADVEDAVDVESSPVTDLVPAKSKA